MKVKGKRTIALLLAAVTLSIGSVAGMALAGAEERGGDYWWEDSSLDCLTPYGRRQVKEIIILIMDRYFGIDVSRMTFEKMYEVWRSLGPEGQEKYYRLFWEYAQKKGFEMPEPPHPEPPLPPPAEVEDVYWWEIVGHPEEYIEWIMEQIAEAKGMSPDEVRISFGELFPGVDLWKMTFDEFDQFLNSLPRPPLRRLLVCLDEVKECPLLIAVFGRVPALSTEREIKEFDGKLTKVIDEVRPSLDKLGRCKFPWEVMAASRGAIHIAVRTYHLPIAEEVYEIIAEKAEALFGIEDVAVIFRDGRGRGPQVSLSSPASSGWRAPFNEPFTRIPGRVKVTPAGRPEAYSTASFAVRRWRWYFPVDPWDEDYIITGHKGRTITPVNMHINQPTAPHAAGRVVDNVGRRAFADAARVGISDARVRPYILIGGTASNPVLRPVVASGDPAVGENIWISAGRSGLTLMVTVGEISDITVDAPLAI